MPGEEVVDWVADHAESAEPSEELMAKLLHISEGNPEVLKLAAKFAFSDDHGLDDVTTADGVVFKEIQNVYARRTEQRRKHERLFVLLAVTGGLRTEELRELVAFDLGIGQRISGYLNRAVGGPLAAGRVPDDETVWRLSPDIFADVTVRYSLGGESDFDFWWACRQLAGAESLGDFLPDVALNLGVAYDGLRRGKDEPERDRMFEVIDESQCLGVVDDVLDEATGSVDSARVVEAALGLAATGVPFDPDAFDDRVESLARGADAVDRVDADPVVVFQSIVGQLYWAHLARGSEAPTVAEFARRFAVACAEQYDHDAAPFLENVYSMAIENLADDHTLSEAADWLDRLTDRAQTAATDAPHDTDAAPFLANVYSMAIASLADDHTPSEAADWLDRLTDRAQTAATDAPHDTDAAQFLANVYSMAIENLADDHTPSEAADWVDGVDRAIRATAENGPHDEDAPSFRGATYAFAVTKVTPERPGYGTTPGGTVAAAWWEFLSDRFLSGASVDCLVAFYRYCISGLAQRHRIDGWLPWLVADALDRTATDARSPAADALCAAVRYLALDSEWSNGLDTQPGTRTLARVAPVAVESPDRFDGLVAETADMLANEPPAGPFADTGVERSEGAATAFVARGYALALGMVASEDGDRLPSFHGRAVAPAEATPDPERALLDLYREAVPRVLAEASSDDPPRCWGYLLDEALSEDRVDSGALYTRLLRRLHMSDAHDDGWLVRLAVDAVDRLRTGEGYPEDGDDRVDLAAEAVSAALDRIDRARGFPGEIPDPVVTSVEALADDAPETYEPFVTAVAERLREEHDSLLVAPEWRCAFDDR